MFLFLPVVILSALAVWFLVPRDAGFLRHIGVGGLVAAITMAFLAAGTLPLRDGSPVLTDVIALLAVVGTYAAILGAAGGAVIWLIARLPMFASAFTGGQGRDPEGDSMAEEARQARMRHLDRQARRQAEQELAVGEVDQELWRKAGAQAGGDEQRHRRLYIEARVVRIRHE